MQDFDFEEDNTFSTSATTVGQNQQLDLETDSKNKDFYILLKQNKLLRHNQSEKSVILKEGVCKLKCYTCGNKFPNIKNCLKKVHQINDENCNKTCGYPNERDLRSKNLTTNRIKRTEQAKAKRAKDNDGLGGTGTSSSSEAGSFGGMAGSPGTGVKANAQAIIGTSVVRIPARRDGGVTDATGDNLCTCDETAAFPCTGTGEENENFEKNEDGQSAKTVPTNPELGIELMDGFKPAQVQHRKSYAGADPKVIKYLNLWDMYKRNPDPKAPITMGELIGEYVRHVWVRGCSTEYVKSLSTVCKNIILPFFGDTSDITSIDYAFHIVPFFEMIRLNPSRLGKMRRNRTINGYGRYLKAIFNYAINSNYILRSPMRLWKELKEVKINRELTYEDGFKIMKYCLPHVRWALELICVTGMRPGRCELFSLQWKDVDFENNKIRIYSTKTNTVRYISFKEDFKEKLLKHKSEAKTDYVVEYNGKQIRTIKRNFSVACQLAKINYHVRPYDYRHVFATTLLNKGADLAAVSKLMGHSRITTKVTSYYETRSTELKRAIDLIPYIPND